jgi:hypothetical protein
LLEFFSGTGAGSNAEKIKKLEKGKPYESVGRKATGLNLKYLRHGSRAAGQNAAP